MMRKFNLDRINLKKVAFGEKEIVLKRTTYQKPKIVNDRLVDKNGNPVGTKGDMYTKMIMDLILQEGCLDHDPRPHYEDEYPGATYDEKKRVITKADGETIQLYERDSIKYREDGTLVHCTPAHTISINDRFQCTYDLSKGESPMITLRPIAMKASTAEILWIYQKQSNDLVVYDELQGICTWEDDKPLEENKINNWWWQWAIRDKKGKLILNEKGHPIIGACYGGTTEPRDMMRREVIDTIKGNVEKNIKPNPDSRRLITCLWQIDDFEKPHGLKPCAFLTIWNVRHDWDGEDYLDMTLVQRSSDFATAGCINQVQYAELLMLIAKETGLKPGIFTWKPSNVQLYDRHFDQAIEMLNREPVDDVDATIKIKEGTTFDNATTKSFAIFTEEDRQKIKTKNPKLDLPLGI